MLHSLNKMGRQLLELLTVHGFVESHDEELVRGPAAMQDGPPTMDRGRRGMGRELSGHFHLRVPRLDAKQIGTASTTHSEKVVTPSAPPSGMNCELTGHAAASKDIELTRFLRNMSTLSFTAHETLRAKKTAALSAMRVAPIGLARIAVLSMLQKFRLESSFFWCQRCDRYFVMRGEFSLTFSDWPVFLVL